MNARERAGPRNGGDNDATEDVSRRAEEILKRCECRAFCEEDETADDGMHIADELAGATRMLRRSLASRGREFKKRKTRDRVASLVLLARTLLLQSRLQEAQAVLEEARTVAPKTRSRVVTLYRASAAWAQGAHDEAAELLLETLADDIEPPRGDCALGESEVLLLLGICLQEQKSSLAAQHAAHQGRFVEYIDQAFEDAFSRRNERREHERSVRAWAEAAQTWLQLAQACQREGQTLMAIKAALHGLYTAEGQQDPVLWLQLAFAYRLTSDDANAEEAAATAFHLEPMGSRARLALERWSPTSWGSYFQYERSMVAKVQARVRGLFARRKFSGLREAHRARRVAAQNLGKRLWDEVAHSAERAVLGVHHGISRFAAVWRGARARAAMRCERAALCIQRVFRGYLTRCAYCEAISDFKAKRKAATSIQRVFRGRRVARQVASLRTWEHAAIRAQAFVRMVLARSLARRMRESAFVRRVVAPLARLQAVHRRRLVARGIVDSRLQRQRSYGVLKWNGIPARISHLKSHGAFHGHVAPGSGASGVGKTRALVASSQAHESLRIFQEVATKKTMLVELGLCGAGTDPSVSESIWERVERGHLQDLRTVSLQNAAAGSTSDFSFAKTLLPRLLQASQLSTVRLGSMQIGDASCEAIVLAFAGSRRLRRLGLEGNRIGDRGAQALAGLAASLEEIDLRSNCVGDAGALCLARAASSPDSSLRVVHLADNFVSEIGALAVRAAARRGVLQNTSLHGNFVSVRLCHEISQLCADAVVRGFHRAPASARRRGSPLSGAPGHLCKVTATAAV